VLASVATRNSRRLTRARLRHYRAVNFIVSERFLLPLTLRNLNSVDHTSNPATNRRVDLPLSVGRRMKLGLLFSVSFQLFRRGSSLGIAFGCLGASAAR